MTKWEDGFYSGITAALLVVYGSHGEDTLACDIVKTIDEKELAKVAKSNDDTLILQFLEKYFPARPARATEEKA